MQSPVLEEAMDRAAAVHSAEQSAARQPGEAPSLTVNTRGAQIGDAENTEESSSRSSGANVLLDSTGSQVTGGSQKPPSAFEEASKRNPDRVPDAHGPQQHQSGSIAPSLSHDPVSYNKALPPEILSLFHKQTPKKTHLKQASNASNKTANGSSSMDNSTHNVAMDQLWSIPRNFNNTASPVIRLHKDFEATKGTKLTDDLVIGDKLSSGMQGGVYDLLKPDGSKAQVVLKWVHKHALLAEVEREWEVGMRLNQLAYKDGSLPGFMGVGAGARTGAKFRGMLLERVNGTTVDKVICTRDFHDVHYVYDLLYSVFTALDRAQGALGFHHSDLRLANVMEVFHDEADKKQKQGNVNTRTQETEPGSPIHSFQQTRGDEPPASDSARHMFKIIDYGLANFEETFAAGPDVNLETDKDRYASRKEIHLQRQNSVSPATGCMAAFPVPLLRNAKPGKLPSPSPIEKLYRFMWRRKGDVYHLVFELGEWLDGRVWPEEDELDVLRLVALIQHITGVKIKCWFSNAMTGEDTVAGWADQACGPFNRHDSCMHFLRRYHVRLLSWLRPSNPGLTAAEALTAPLFTKRVSLRGVIHGCSTTYYKWTKAPTRKKLT